MPDPLRERILVAHRAWLELPEEKRPRSLRAYIERHERMLLRAALRSPSVFRRLSRDVQAAWKGERFVGVSQAVLQKHMALITAAYLRQPAGARLEDFIQELVRECVDEEELLARLDARE